ncbi:MAG: aminopeptidase P family protein, partial [Actinobacteria bacterium]|nr:aminopeptidase P family protein [Actinomycetota bacterium]
MDHELRRKRVASRLAGLGVDALLVTRLPNVRYLTGFTGSNGQVIVGADAAVFLTDGRYIEQSRREVEGVERRVYRDGLPDAVAEACRAIGASRLGFESAGVTHRTWGELAERLEGIGLVPVGEEVERLRWTKEAGEVAAIERAQAATDEAFKEILGRIAEGMTERELAFELGAAMHRAGAHGVAFDTIAAFGENAAEPHHEPTGRALARGDVVQMAFGAPVDGYHADMTRPIAVGEP